MRFLRVRSLSSKQAFHWSFGLLLAVIMLVGCDSKESTAPQFEWTLEDELEHNENRNDPEKWSQKNWDTDLSNFAINGNPLVKGVFPVPDYKFVDSTFNGLGNSGSWEGLDFHGKKIIHHSFFVNKCLVNEQYISGKPNEVFFTILVLTDSVDLQSYSHTNVNITSRNHPHYVGQGYVKTSENKIDFISFITADRNAYAIVNMRLFDLRIGRIVLIAPKKDGSLRSLQLDSPILSTSEMEMYVMDLLNADEKVINFFNEGDHI